MRHLVEEHSEQKVHHKEFCLQGFNYLLHINVYYVP